ncbi:MAG TPA: c-type cytochrome [Terriglobales bacterium]
MAILNGRNRRLLWVVATLIATALLVVVFLQLRRPAVTTRALYIVGVPERGAALFYGDKQCAICHSINGSGGRVAPDLTGMQPGSPAMGWLTTVLWNHAPGMWRQFRQQNKSYPQLDPQEMADILAFLYQSGNVDRAGDPSAGQRVFNEKGCVRCHAVAGVGGKSAPELSGIADGVDSTAWARAMLNHAGSMVDPITVRLGQWPQFTGKEMNDLIKFVSPGAPRPAANKREIPGNAERGWSVFQGRCMQCHSVNGLGGVLGPELGPQHELPLTTAQFAAVFWNHAPEMLQQSHDSGVPAPVFQGQEMADLLAFLASLRYFEPSGSAVAGAQVFSERGCAACHGSTAEGTQSGPALKSGAQPFTAVSFSAALWQHGPRMVDRSNQLGMPWPTLKPTDIGDLVSFLNAPAPPK